MTIGSRINALRKEKGYTQEYIAEQLHVTRQAVSKWEQDQTSPDTWNLIELAKLLDSSVEYITLGKREVAVIPPQPPLPTKTYCGRSCESCEKKTLLNCSGCKGGTPWNPVTQCDIAVCCHSRNLKSCNLCKLSESCKKLRQKEFVPDMRLKKVKAAAEIKHIQDEIAAGCKVWTSVLPFVAIAYLIGLLMASFFPYLLVISGAAYTLCLLMLLRQSDHYKPAAILLLFVTAFYSIGSFLPEEYAQDAIITNALAAIFDLFRLKCEYNGHQTISTHFDCNLSESYERLWKWYLILPLISVMPS